MCPPKHVWLAIMLSCIKPCRAVICRSMATRRKSNINFQRHVCRQIKCYIHILDWKFEWHHTLHGMAMLLTKYDRGISGHAYLHFSGRFLISSPSIRPTDRAIICLQNKLYSDWIGQKLTCGNVWEHSLFYAKKLPWWYVRWGARASVTT